jgi:anti-sigma factor RsiW
MLRCQAVQTHLTAYIHGELPLKARRRVSAHLERCERCQSAYQRQRELVRDLEQELPRVGQAQSAQLARVWSKVQTELDTPARRRRPSLRYRASYGVAALLLVIVMFVPYALNMDNSPRASLRTLPAHVVAFATNVPDERVLNRVPENALSRTAPAVTRIRFTYVTPQAALTPAPRP